MLETRHTPHYYAEEVRLGHKIGRSSSDAQDRKNKKSGKKPAPTSSKENSLRSNVSGRQPGAPLIINHYSGSNRSQGARHPTDSPRQQQANNYSNRLISSSHNSGIHVNRGYSPDTGEVVRSTGPTLIRSQSSARAPAPKPEVVKNVPEIVHGMPSSATDSMKLLAKNKTDDQKTSRGGGTGTQETGEGKEDPPKHYVYNEDIYAVSTKTKAATQEQDENPIITRMKEMVLEKNRSTKMTPRDLYSSGRDPYTSDPYTSDPYSSAQMSSAESPESPYAEIAALSNGVVHKPEAEAEVGTDASSARTLKVRDVIVARTPSPADVGRLLAVPDVAPSVVSSDGEGTDDLNKAGELAGIFLYGC